MAGDRKAGGDGLGDGVGRSPSPVYHGGDLAQARAAHPRAPEPWIDLSTGINPVAYPVPEIPADLWTRLPEAGLVAALEATAAQAYGLDDVDCVAATPGTQALIQMLPRLMPGGRVAILGFTYQEHARVWREAGREVTVVDDWAALEAFDVAVVVNPNNPDGRLVPAADLAALALRMGAEGRRLIVDEAFVDVLPEGASLAPRLPLLVDEAFVDVLPEGASLAPRLPLPGLVVLRSFGKTWGLAGLRLGFALADAGFAARIRAAFGPWAVSGPAVAVGRAALADRAWLEATRARLVHDAARLDAMLAASGLRVLGGTPLFRLATSPEAAKTRDRLASEGIHLRYFPHDPALLRFGLPDHETAWRRLEDALCDKMSR
jgi:cobalamin biosynthesis protein CobC